MLKIEASQLSEEALCGIIDDFILREGTDYGLQEMSIDAKRKQVLGLLSKGLAHIVFDPETESTTLIPKESR